MGRETTDARYAQVIGMASDRESMDDLIIEDE